MEPTRYQRYLAPIAQDVIRGLAQLVDALPGDKLDSSPSPEFTSAALLLKDAMECWERLSGTPLFKDPLFWSIAQNHFLQPNDQNSDAPPDIAPEPRLHQDDFPSPDLHMKDMHPNERAPETSVPPSVADTEQDFPDDAALVYIGDNPLISRGRAVKRMASGLFVVQTPEGRIPVDPLWVICKETFDGISSDSGAFARFTNMLPQEKIFDPGSNPTDPASEQEEKGAGVARHRGSFSVTPPHQAVLGPPNPKGDGPKRLF